MEPRQKTSVLITVDTEVYPLAPGWREDRLARDLDRDLWGRTARGEYGLRHQLEVLRRHRVKASFFVEPLFASAPAVGLGPLRDVVALVLEHGQEVQLHLHPEWVPELPGAPVPDRGHLLTSYPEDEQRVLLEIAVENLVRAGAPAPTAFRAGDFAANDATLRALRRVGLRYDSSYDHAYLGAGCAISAPAPIWDATWREEGLWEVPVTTFRDYPGHHRHCQLGACSVRELVHAVDRAAAAGWTSVVVVSHSFELLANRRSPRPLAPRRAVVERFEALCAHLGAGGAGFASAHFADLRPGGAPATAPIEGSLLATAARMVGQAAARVAARLG